MSARVRRHADVLKLMTKAKPQLCKAIIKGAEPDLIHCRCECVQNVLKGNVPLTPAQKTRLTRYKQDLRALDRKTTSQKRKKQILPKGGFLPALLGPLLAPVIAPLASQVIGQVAKKVFR